MASSLFALLDDIATLLDDISILTKVAAKKTVRVEPWLPSKRFAFV